MTPLRIRSSTPFKPQDGVHVYPIGDDKVHVMSRECWCQPEYDEEQEVWIHHSADGREEYESGKRKPH